MKWVRVNVYVCWLQEMLISPTLLDFLEQALEPIPMEQLLASQNRSCESGLLFIQCPFYIVRAPCVVYMKMYLLFVYHTADDLGLNRTAADPETIDLDESGASLGGGQYGALPIDIVVYLHIQPSVIRLTCLPVSRVQCLIKIPAVDVVFSTKRADADDDVISVEDVRCKSERCEIGT